MAPEVLSALIGGVAGLITGVIGSLIAPWVQLGVEKARKRHERRSSLITEWRAGVEKLREIEYEVSPVIPGPVTEQGTPSQLVVSVDRSDPTSADLGRMSWFHSLRPHLSDDAGKEVGRLSAKRVSDRGHGKLPGVLTAEIDRIEQKWKLV